MSVTKRPLVFYQNGLLDDGNGNNLTDENGDQLGFMDPPLVLTFKFGSQLTDEQNNPITDENSIQLGAVTGPFPLSFSVSN